MGFGLRTRRFRGVVVSLNVRVVNFHHANFRVARKPTDRGADDSWITDQAFGDCRIQLCQRIVNIVRGGLWCGRFALGRGFSRGWIGCQGFRQSLQVFAIALLRVERANGQSLGQVRGFTRFQLDPATQPIEQTLGLCVADRSSDGGVHQRSLLPGFLQIRSIFIEFFLRPHRVREVPETGLVDIPEFVTTISRKKRGRVTLLNQWQGQA